MQKSQLFFFYGTLLKNQGNHRLLREEGVEFLGNHTTKPAYTMLTCGGFPIVLPYGKTPIKGELYQVSNEKVIHRLYSLEGFTGEIGHHANWYDAKKINTEKGEALMFIQHDNKNNLKVVKSGDWLNS